MKNGSPPCVALKGELEGVRSSATSKASRARISNPRIVFTEKA